MKCILNMNWRLQGSYDGKRKTPAGFDDKIEIEDEIDDKMIEEISKQVKIRLKRSVYDWTGGSYVTTDMQPGNKVKLIGKIKIKDKDTDECDTKVQDSSEGKPKE